MKKYIISIISFLAGICTTNAKEYVPKVRFESLRSDFLPSNEVRKLYQDSDGFIWIPTYNGLARYDGYDVLSYGTKDVVEGTFNPFELGIAFGIFTSDLGQSSFNNIFIEFRYVIGLTNVLKNQGRNFNTGAFVNICYIIENPLKKK